MKKARPQVGLWHRYVRSRLGEISFQSVSLYALVCEALEKDGRPKPASKTFKVWVRKNEDFIWYAVNPKPVSKWSVADPVVSAQRPKQTSYKPAAKVKTTFNATDEFLSTYEWRKLRMQALKKHGARCQCCGASPATGAVLNVDHIKPRRLFPELALSLANLQVLCHECNHGKGNWDQTDWRPAPEEMLDVEQLAHLRDIMQ